MRDNGIDVEFVDVDLLSGAEREHAIDEVKKLNPDCSFPTICIGDTVIIGFHEGKLKKALEIE
jgi:glutaredoxin